MDEKHFTREVKAHIHKLHWINFTSLTACFFSLLPRRKNICKMSKVSPEKNRKKQFRAHRESSCTKEKTVAKRELACSKTYVRKVLLHLHAVLESHICKHTGMYVYVSYYIIHPVIITFRFVS